MGRTPRPREPSAADWRPPQPAPWIPQCGATAPRDWPRPAKARPPLARAAGGSRRPGRAWVAFLVGGGGRAVRVPLLWSGCGQLGQAAGAIGRCWARRGAPRAGRALRPARGCALHSLGRWAAAGREARRGGAGRGCARRAWPRGVLAFVK